MKDELLQGMKQLIEDRMSEIERKIESSQHKLETRVEKELCKRCTGRRTDCDRRQWMDDVPFAAVLDTGRKVWCVHYTPH